MKKRNKSFGCGHRQTCKTIREVFTLDKICLNVPKSSFLSDRRPHFVPPWDGNLPESESTRPSTAFHFCQMWFIDNPNDYWIDYYAQTLLFRPKFNYKSVMVSQYVSLVHDPAVSHSLPPHNNEHGIECQAERCAWGKKKNSPLPQTITHHSYQELWWAIVSHYQLRNDGN